MFRIMNEKNPVHREYPCSFRSAHPRGLRMKSTTNNPATPTNTHTKFSSPTFANRFAIMPMNSVFILYVPCVSVVKGNWTKRKLSLPSFRHPTGMPGIQATHRPRAFGEAFGICLDGIELVVH